MTRDLFVYPYLVQYGGPSQVYRLSKCQPIYEPSPFCYNILRIGQLIVPTSFCKMAGRVLSRTIYKTKTRPLGKGETPWPSKGGVPLSYLTRPPTSPNRCQLIKSGEV